VVTSRPPRPDIASIGLAIGGGGDVVMRWAPFVSNNASPYNKVSYTVGHRLRFGGGQLVQVETSSTSHNFGKLALDQEYVFRVQTTHNGVTSPPRATRVFLQKPPLLPAPTGLQVQPAPNALLVSWDAVADASIYQIGYAHVGSLPKLWRIVPHHPNVQYGFYGLDPEFEYVISVRAVDIYNLPGVMASANARPLPPSNVPHKPPDPPLNPKPLRPEVQERLNAAQQGKLSASALLNAIAPATTTGITTAAVSAPSEPEQPVAVEQPPTVKSDVRTSAPIAVEPVAPPPISNTPPSEEPISMPAPPAESPAPPTPPHHGAPGDPIGINPILVPMPEPTPFPY